MPAPKPKPPPSRDGLLTRRELASLLRVGLSELAELRKDGQIIKPVELRSLLRWRAAEVLDWIHAGMPDPSRWTWAPVVSMNLAEYIEHQHAKLRELSDQIRQVNELAAAGVTTIDVRRAS